MKTKEEIFEKAFRIHQNGKIKEAQKRKELEQREQQRELRRLETMEKEQQARIERKKERLSSLQSQLLEEARRQEYQELSAQIEADIVLILTKNEAWGGNFSQKIKS